MPKTIDAKAAIRAITISVLGAEIVLENTSKPEKVDTIHNRRLVISKIGPSDAYKKLFEDIGNRFKDRDGGYTRIIRIPSSNTKSKFKSYYRKGDGAELARIELVRESNQIDNSADSEESNKVTDPSNGTD